jgi:hypothetical protein
VGKQYVTLPLITPLRFALMGDLWGILKVSLMYQSAHKEIEWD